MDNKGNKANSKPAPQKKVEQKNDPYKDTSIEDLMGMIRGANTEAKVLQDAKSDKSPCKTVDFHIGDTKLIVEDKEIIGKLVSIVAIDYKKRLNTMVQSQKKKVSGLNLG